jgi:hypothetical protein
MRACCNGTQYDLTAFLSTICYDTAYTYHLRCELCFDVSDARAPYLQQRHSMSSYWIQCQVNPTCRPPARSKHPIPKALPRSANHIRTVCHQRCRACAEKPTSLASPLFVLLLQNIHQCHITLGTVTRSVDTSIRRERRHRLLLMCSARFSTSTVNMWKGSIRCRLTCRFFRSRRTPHG